MNINVRMETAPPRRFAGRRLTMSFTHNRTPELWRSFMPLRRGLPAPDENLYSIEIYPPRFFEAFDPGADFEKWAAVAAGASAALPDGLEQLDTPGGRYAVFLYRGLPSAAAPFYQYIFGTWLPEQGYAVDDRPHFAVMDARYRQDDPGSEEELWIPVRPLAAKQG